MQSKLNSIKAICEEGDRSGADRLDEIYQITLAPDNRANTVILPETGSLDCKQDPEHMNDDRAGWASTALRAFQVETGTDDEDAMSDLLADLMHLADREGEDFTADLRRGARHYVEETTGLSVVRVSRVLGGRELAAVLAALRMLQGEMEAEANDGNQFLAGDVLTDGGTLDPMTPNEIDALCERINR